MAGRENQRLRTRRELLRAAARLVAQGGKPSLDEVAAAALVSRATAYRHFPNIDALLLEASLEIATPDEADVLGPDAPSDITLRVLRVDAAFHDMVTADEVLMRTFLAHALVQGGGAEDAPVRQNRRSPLIRQALEPARGELSARERKMLERALALIIGGEAILICKDVLQLDDTETREVKRWAIRTLVAGALENSKQKRSPLRKDTVE